MKDSKRSSNPKLSLIQQEHYVEQGSCTTPPSCTVNISRLNTIDDSGDKIFEGEKSMRQSTCFDRDRLDLQLRESSNNHKEKDVNVFKQLPEAKELLKTIPIEHRKKVRHIIKMYEDERREYEIEIRRLSKFMHEEPNQRKLSLKGMQIDIPNEKEECEVTLTPTSLCFSDAIFEQVSLSLNHQQIIKKNQFIQFMNEGFDHTKLRHEQQLQVLRQQITEKTKDIKKKQLKIEELNNLLSILQMKIKGYEQNLKCVNQQNQGLQKKIQDVQKSIKQKREESRPNITITVTKPDQTREIEDSKLSVYKDLTIQNRRSTSPPDRSPTYTNRQPKISLRDELIKSNNFHSEKKQEEENHHSECDSSEFGKEKVVEKRKLRKLFANLLAASETSEKKEILQKLSIEIGLKTKDINSLFKSI